MNESSGRKFKHERVENCLSCMKFVKCNNIGKFEECVNFEEIKGEVWMIERTHSFLNREGESIVR
jgi:hypothetical protein